MNGTGSSVGGAGVLDAPLLRRERLRLASGYGWC